MRWIGIAVLLALVGCHPTPIANPPSISLSPQQAAKGESVTASLRGFSGEGASVFVAGIEAKVTLASRDTVVFVVPGGVSGGPQAVQIAAGGQKVGSSLGVLGNVVANQLVVTLKPGVDPNAARAQLEAKGFKVLEDFQPLGGKEADNPCSGSLSRVDVGGKPLGQALAELEQLGIVYKADPQSAGGADGVDYLGAIGASGAKGRNLSGKGVIIAVLDTGVSQTPVVGGKPSAVLPGGDSVNLLPGYNFVAGNTDVSDDFTDPNNLDPQTQQPTPYHGTPIAVLAAGSKFGVASQASVLPVKVCDKAGLCLASNVVKGVCYALSQVPDRSKLVLNLSLGGDTPVSVLEAILSYALSKNTLVAAAGGNAGPDIRDGTFVRLTPKHYPAAHKLPGLVAVAALAASGTGPAPTWRPADFSSRGVNVDYLDIAAPGQDISIGGYSYRGTSFATPLVAGALAMWREANPALSPADIEAKLKAAATPLSFAANEVGAGLLNLSSQP